MFMRMFVNIFSLNAVPINEEDKEALIDAWWPNNKNNLEYEAVRGLRWSIKLKSPCGLMVYNPMETV